MGASFGRGGHHPVEVETRGPPDDPGSESEPEITETLADLRDRDHGTQVRHRSARRAPVSADRAPGAAHRLVPNLAPG